MAEDDNTPDYSFIPETFKKDDGYDLDGFKEHYNEVVAFKAIADEKAEAAPKEPTDYAFAVPDEFAWPEGFDPRDFPIPVLDDNGEQVISDGKALTRPVETSDFVSPNDPDIGALQEVLLKHGADKGLMGDLVSLLLNREIRTNQEAAEKAAEYFESLGPNREQRKEAIVTELGKKFSAEEVTDFMGGVGSASAFRIVEELLKNSSRPATPRPGNKPDLDSMTVDEMFARGFEQQLQN